MAQENHRSSSNSIECKQIYERQWKVCKIENNKVNSNIQIRPEISGKDKEKLIQIIMIKKATSNQIIQNFM